MWIEIARLTIERMSENDALVTRYMNESEFQDVACEALVREIVDKVLGQ